LSGLADVDYLHTNETIGYVGLIPGDGDTPDGIDKIIRVGANPLRVRGLGHVDDLQSRGDGC
jgi:hypothetical protein